MKSLRKLDRRRRNDSDSEFEMILDNAHYEEQMQREIDELPSPDISTKVYINRRRQNVPPKPKKINLNDL